MVPRMIAWLRSLLDYRDAERLCGATRSPRWPAIRDVHLSQFPRCAACGTQRDPEVHHIRPVHLYPAPEYELGRDNLLTLCGSEANDCHLRFGHLGDWSAWDPEVARYAAEYRDRVLRRLYDRLER